MHAVNTLDAGQHPLRQTQFYVTKILLYILTEKGNLSRFYSNEGLAWLMHLCVSTDPSGSIALHFGLVCPSTPFELYRRFTSPSKRTLAADSQHFGVCRTRMYVHQLAISPALRWRSSERKKKLSNRLPASSFFQSFWPDDLTSPTELSHCPDRSLIEAMYTLRMTCPLNNGTIGHGG